MPDLRRLQQLIEVSKTDEGDGKRQKYPLETILRYHIAISAIVIAIQMITKQCRKLKYIRKIVLVTNGRGTMDADDLSEITKKITEDNMDLVVLYGGRNPSRASITYG